MTGRSPLGDLARGQELFGAAYHLVRLRGAQWGAQSPTAGWLARDYQASLTALRYLSLCTDHAAFTADVAVLAGYLAWSRVQVESPKQATDATAWWEWMYARWHLGGKDNPEVVGAAVPPLSAHRARAEAVRAAGVRGLLEEAQKRYGGHGVVSQAGLQRLAAERGPGGKASPGATVGEEETAGPAAPHANDPHALMRGSGYKLLRRDEFVGRPVEGGAAPCVRGEAMVALHLPYCDRCRAEPPESCEIVTLAAQVDRRVFHWSAGAPEVPPVGVPIAWTDDMIRRGADIVQRKYLPGGVVARLPDETGESPQSAGGAGVSPPATRKSSGGNALASFGVVTEEWAVPEEATADEGRMAGWLEPMVQGAVERVQAAVPRSGQLSWAAWGRAIAPTGSAVKEKVRIVLDARPLNEFQRDWKMRLVTLPEIMAGVQPGSYCAMRDVKSGYTHVRLDESMYQYAQTHLPEVDAAGVPRLALYQYRRLPFGEKSAVAAFSALTAFVVWLTNKRCPDMKGSIKAYIDDFWAAGDTRAECQRIMDTFDGICGELGIALEHAKDQGPATRLTVLGVDIDTVEGTVSLPPGKVAKRLYQLLVMDACIQRRIAVPKKALRSLAGRLQHWCIVFPGGRAFLSRIWQALSWGEPSSSAPPGSGTRPTRGQEGTVPLHDNRLSGAVRELRWWLEQIRYRGLKPQRLLGSLGTPVLEFVPGSQSDAAGDLGWGLQLGPVALWGTWSEAEAKGSSSFKELLPVVHAFERYGPLLADQTVAVATDNSSNVFAINYGRSRGDAYGLMQRVAQACSRHGVTPVGLWVPREANEQLDALSRCVTLDAAVLLCRTPVVDCRGSGAPADGGAG